MANRRLLVAIALVAGVVLIAIAAVYWAEPAKSLPSFFPGHEAGSNHHHVKHGIAAFLVAPHLATAIVLLLFFWRDWWRILKGLGRSLRDRGIAADDTDARLGWLLVVGTIPAAILGLALESKLRSVFASAQSAAIFLCLNGALLYGAELLRRRALQVSEDDDTRIARQVSFPQSF